MILLSSFVYRSKLRQIYFTMGPSPYISLVLLLLCTLIQVIQCNTFHIVTSSSSPCPGESSGEPCITLQQLADNPSQSANTTLMFVYGNHSLSSLLLISNGYNFTMSGANATILCTSQTGSIQIQQFNHILITEITIRACSENAFGSSGINLQVSDVSFLSCGNTGCYSENVLLTNVYLNATSTLSVRGVQNFTVEDSRFEDINDNNGALQIYATSAVNIMTSTFVSNGAGVKVSGISGTVIISDTTFSKHRARAIHTLNVLTSLYVTNCNFTDNNGVSSGGAMYIVRAVPTTIVSSKFSYNTANEGGAIYANEQVSLTIVNCDFISNHGLRGGAVVSTHVDNSITIMESTFTSNIASENGGAIYAINIAPVLIQTSFINNTAGDNGGTVYLTGNLNTELRVFQSYFYNSTATSGEGGVMFTDANNANVSIVESNFTFNSAASCGVVNVKNSNHYVNFTGNIFTYNKATGADERGGVACIRNSSLFLLSSTFNHNTAAGDAGVFSIEESMVTIDGSTFHNNSAADDGGVMFTSLFLSTYNIRESVFSQNTAGSDAGVIFIARANSRLEISTSTLIDNSATDRGGAIALIATTLRMNETAVCNNTADLGPVISACNSEVTVPRKLSSITDPIVSICILYDGCISRNDFITEAEDVTTTEAEAAQTGKCIICTMS